MPITEREAIDRTICQFTFKDGVQCEDCNSYPGAKAECFFIRDSGLSDDGSYVCKSCMLKRFNIVVDLTKINEWVECGIMFDTFYKLIKDQSADGMPVGMLLDLEGFDDYMLVGDVNQVNGQCDCCTWIDSNLIVLKYILLVIPQKAKKLSSEKE